MKIWIVLLAIGALALATGGTLVSLGLHHTIGLYGMGLGALLVIGGLGGGLLSGKRVKTEEKKTVVQPRQRGGARKAIIAVLVVIVIGVGTFYGASYLNSAQPGASVSTSTTSGNISSTGSGGSSTSSQSSGQTQTTGSNTSPGSSSSQSVSSSGSTVSQTIFILTGTPTITLNGPNATLTADYLNSGNVARNVNFYQTTNFKNGTEFITAELFDQPGPKVLPNGTLSIQVPLDGLSPGSYIITFYIGQGTDTTHYPVSVSTTLPFTIP